MFSTKEAVIYGVRKFGTKRYLYIGKTIVNNKHRRTYGDLIYQVKAEMRLKRHIREAYDKKHANSDFRKLVVSLSKYEQLTVDVLEVVKSSWFQADDEFKKKVLECEEKHILENYKDSLINKVFPTRPFVELNRKNIKKYIGEL